MPSFAIAALALLLAALRLDKTNNYGLGLHTGFDISRKRTRNKKVPLAPKSDFFGLKRHFP